MTNQDPFCDTTELVRCVCCGVVFVDPASGYESGDHEGWVCDDCINDNDRDLYTCTGCGKVFERIPPDRNGNHYCVDCQKEKRLSVCCDCGFLYPEDELARTVYGDYVCSECADRDFSLCDECNQYAPISMIETMGNGEHVCSYCRDNAHSHRCEDCGDLFFERDMFDVGGDSEYRWVCESCADNYSQCEDCGEWFHVESDDWHGDCGGVDVCESCFEERYNNESIHEYHWGRDVDWYSGPYYVDGEAEDTITYGVEIEMAGGGFDESDMSDGEELYHWEHDSSLDDSGIELITQPCSLLYHQNEFGWERLLMACIANGYRSHEAKCSCGLHVHIGRQSISELDELKLDAFINRYACWWERIARRNSMWGEMTVGKPIRVSLDDVKYKCNRHNMAVNHGNEETVEIRIAKGSLLCETVIGTIEIYDAAIHYLRNTSIQELYACDGKSMCRVWQNFEKYIVKNENVYKYAVPMLARLMPKCPATDNETIAYKHMKHMKEKDSKRERFEKRNDGKEVA